MQAPDHFDPAIGIADEIAPGLRRIVAPNPSPMTYRGTNTYLLGTSEIAVIDPGPVSSAHLAAILDAITPVQHISHILVTHTHIDHSPLASDLAAATGAPIYAFGGATAGRSEVMQQLADAGLAGGGEGIDAGFAPDVVLGDGDEVAGEGWSLKTLWTPGHLGNHISFLWGDAVFTGDHVMGWASSLVSPPDGDLTQFMWSCERLSKLKSSVYYCGHGAPVTDPSARLDWLIKHRLGRETDILSALKAGPATATALARQIYTETPAALLGAATRNVFAHLVDLHGKNKVTVQGQLSADATFERV